MGVYAPGTEERDLKRINQALQLHASLISTLQALLSTVTNTLTGDVSLNDNAYHDGPSCAQGTSGTWLAFGSVVVLDTSGAATIDCKLWDGATVIASSRGITGGANLNLSVTLSGAISSPAGNIRISCADGNGAPAGKIKFNASGNSKDSKLTVVKIA